MDASEVGRYGTLSLLKRLDPNTVVATYPIDDPEVTVGRDQSCSIRLYYPAVSALHCRIFFDQDRKAFIQILGTNGVTIDGCPVFPSNGPSPTTVPLPNQSTLDIHKRSFRFAYPPKHLRPLLLATPAASPAPADSLSPTKTRRALRMSMIHSAHVFSPAPSANPRENLRVLQSPLKAPFARAPGTPEHARGRTEEAQEIVLVESDCPRVVEEERDLIILDHVTVQDPPPPSPSSPSPFHHPASPSPSPASPSPFTAASSIRDTSPSPSARYSPVRSLPLRRPVATPSRAPPQTPVRRPRPSLHRAVLIRSAQRTAMRREMQREEEDEDAEEVEEFIASVVMEQSDEDEEEAEGEDGQGEYEGEAEGEEGQSEDEEDEEMHQEQGEQGQPGPTQVSGWRRSLDVVRGGIGWALRAASLEPRSEPEQPAQEPETHDAQEQAERHELRDYGDYDPESAYADEYDRDEHESQDDVEMHEADLQGFNEQLSDNGEGEDDGEGEGETDFVPELAPSSPFRRPQQRPLGQFMTPQAVRTSRLHPRYSVGGFARGGLGDSLGAGSEQRYFAGAATGPRRVRVVEPWKVADIVVPLKEEVKEEGEEWPQNRRANEGEGSANVDAGGVPASPARAAKREKLTAAEREAIRERRRSALATPDTFFPGSSMRRAAVRFPADPATPRLPSLIEAVNAAGGIAQGGSAAPKEESAAEAAMEAKIKASAKEDAGEDTQVLLARMRSMVEGVKRRQSAVPSVPAARLSLSPRKKRTGRFSLLAPQSSTEAEAEDQDGDVEMHDGKPEAEEDPASAGGAEDVEMHNGYAGAEMHAEPSAEERPELQTPRMDDLRHVFGSTSALPPKTPRMDGVRQMFMQGREWQVATPAFEGVGEMLATPTAYRARPDTQKEQEQEDVGDVQDGEVQKVPEDVEEEQREDVPPEEVPEPPTTRNTRARKTPTPTPPAVRRTPRSVAATRHTQVTDLDTVPEHELMNVASEQVEEEQTQEVGRPGKRTRARTAELSDTESTTSKPRARKAKAGQDDTAAEQTVKTALHPKPSSKKPTRAVIVDVSEDESRPLPGKTVRRTRKVTSDLEDNAPESSRPAPARRTRKATSDIDDALTPATEKPIRSTRTGRTPQPQPRPHMVPQAEKAKPARRTYAQDDSNDNDPLDSLHDQFAAEPALAAARVRRTPRGRAQTEVKEEESEANLAPDVQETAASRGTRRRAPVPAAAARSSIPLPKSTARSRMVASAKVAETPGVTVGNKENTPERETKPAEGEQESAAPAPQAKVTRTGRAVASGSNVRVKVPARGRGARTRGVAKR
ncbi:hypothetical protein OBBRIDRAFT_799298 [Obba rivulosa]|uniref:FHA domain-containing protein n=1 Tax=Obba rivulosa TaxID=1052685 RepID=A0A8E2AGV5_9APHY|nr:hypothetical protein OBBRIDRAFT_799298 [Obba rivulosa]